MRNREEILAELSSARKQLQASNFDRCVLAQVVELENELASLDG